MEVDFSYDIIQHDKLKVHVNANWSYYRTKILDLIVVESLSLGESSTVSGRATEGYPLRVF